MRPIGYLGETPLGSLYVCRYSRMVAIEKWMRFISSVYPQSPVLLAVHARLNQDIIKAERKEDISAFNAMDENCNACKHFKRLKSDNEKGSSAASNFVYGDCMNDGQVQLIRNKRDGYQIMVHVADYMGMTCWVARN